MEFSIYAGMIIGEEISEGIADDLQEGVNICKDIGHEKNVIGY